MKRIIFSGIITTGLHIALFFSFSILLLENDRPAITEKKSVMVTMSYISPKPEKERHKKKPAKRVIKNKLATAPPCTKKAKSKTDESPKAQVHNPESEPKTCISQKPENKQISPTLIDKTEENSNLQSKYEPYNNSSVLKTTKPCLKNNPLPKYPLKAKRRGYEGIVELMVQVSENGEVTNLWVFKSSKYISLDNQAVQAVRKWLFEPAKRNGKPVQMWVKIPVKFELK
jgi:periplasmic protein TonB